MPAVKLPKKLSARLGFLADRVRKIRTLRAVARAAFLIPVAAFACVMADAYFNFPTGVRYGLLGGWVGLVLYSMWTIRRARTADIDLEAIASAVEEQFPRLAERLTTAVELSESADASNGSPALIEEVVRDADTRARKLDLAVTFPTAGVVSGFFAAMALLLMLVAPVFFAPRGGEYLRRFFAPWYTPVVRVDYKVVVTSGDPAVKRGDPVTLTAYVEPTKDGARLPTSAVAVISVNGKDERVAMTSDEPNVWYLRRPAADGDFDYRIEAGAAASESHHVTVVEPVTLASARVTVKAPVYAAHGREAEAAVEGLGELSALQYSTITFDLRFHPRPSSAALDFTPNAKEEARGVKIRTPLRVAADGTVQVSVPAVESGTFALTAAGQSGVKSEFPAQPLRVHPDEAPKFPQVTGLGDKAKKVRPGEKIVLNFAATDDVAVAKLALEWRVNDGEVQTLPLDARNLNTGQAEGKIAVPLADKAKVGDKFQCRLVATDNRNLPEQKLSPQSSYYPAKEVWAEFEVDPAAAALAEQEILQKRDEIEKALKEIREEVDHEKGAANLFKRGTGNRKGLNAEDQEKLRRTATELAETIRRTEDLARDTAVTPELARLADKIGRVANEQLRDADSALSKAKDPTRADEQHQQFQKAEEALEKAIQKINELLKENEQTAQERLDKRKLEDLAEAQRDLTDKAKAADPKDAAELAKKQKAIEEELKKLREQSDAIKRAADAAKADEAAKLAEQARKIADEMRDLNRAIDKTEKDPGRLADLRKRQNDLARKAKELAEKTDAATKAAQTPPLNPADAAAAKEALDQGKLDDAVTAQEQARQELERLARDLEEAAANARDPREAAKQLARLQDDLRRRVNQETAKTPLDKLTPERKAALAKEQDAIARAASKIKTADQATEAVKQQAAKDAADAKDMLDKGVANAADRKMQEAKDSLEQLADKLPSKDERLTKAKDDLAKLKAQQEEVRQKADTATRGAEKQDPDAPATQRDVAKKLANAAKKQAELADQVNKLDAPGQEARQAKAADALQRAAADMTAGRPQDVAASQQAAKRELDRLEQALNGQQPADDKVAELAKKQKEIAAEAAKTPDKAAQGDLAKRQEEVARDLAKVQTPEAATAQAEAADAAKKAADAGRDGGAKGDEFAKKAKDAADKLDKLNDRVNGKENPADAAGRLAKKQKENADAQAAKQDHPATGAARKKAAQALEEVKNMRPGADAQKAKQQAQDALQKAANQLDPKANTEAQKQAADALQGLADKLAGDKQAKAEPKGPADAEQLTKDQRDLAEQTKKDAAGQKPGDAGKQARKEALDKAAQAQKDLAKQAGEMPGRDSPKDLQQAQDAMTKAQEELERGNAEGAVQKQKEAADALDKLAKEAKKNKQEQADAGHPDLATKQQAEAAKQLAEEQKRLRDEAMQAAAEQKAEAARPDNPAGDVAKQQQEIARQAADLAKSVADRQGEKAEQSKQARQAADAARQAADGAKNGDLNQAKQAGKQAGEALEKMGQDPSGGQSSQKAKDLARQQADVNQKLEQMAKDAGAGKAQQAARQEQLEKQARDVGEKLDEMGKPGEGGQPSPGGQQAKAAGESAKQAGDKLQAAKEAGKQGNGQQAGEARDAAAQAMEKAAQQAKAAAKEMAGGDMPGSPGAGKALGEAQDQMGEAGKRLGGNQPGEAGGAMEKAADALQKAAGQLGQPGGMGEGQGEGQPGSNPGGKNPGGNVGAPGGKPDLTQFGPDVAKHNGKAWGELPGEIKTKVLQEMKARYGEDYARNIKLYFEQLAERK